MAETKYDVFISHKSEDRPIADTLKRALEDLSKYKLTINVSGDMPAGAPWRNWIDDHLTRSQVLIFLYTSTESEVDWRWCVYELGIFHGKKVTEKKNGVKEYGSQNILCIKHPDIANPPSPIEHIQVRNADTAGITKLFEQLVYEKGMFSPEPLVDQQDRSRLDEAVEKVIKSFKPLVVVELFDRRIEIVLSHIESGDIKEKELADADVSGNAETMSFLRLPKAGAKWRTLYSDFKERRQSAWLDQIVDSIERIKKNLDPIDVMQPFAMPNGETVIPIFSRIDTFRVREEKTTIIKPKQLIVIFAPMPQMADLPYTLRDMRDITNKWTNYPPTSVVRIRWKGRSGTVYKPEDMEGDVDVCAANYEFARLYDFIYNDFFPNSDDNPHRRLTDSILLNRIKNYIEPDNFSKFMQDQERLFRRIILESSDDMALIPFQFNDRHPSERYKNQAYLPYLISKHLVGDVSGPHDMYLLVCYIKDFWPIGHPENPGGERQ